MAKRISKGARYRFPLPIKPVDLPPLIPHNPLSWIYWTFSYITSVQQTAQKIQVEIVGEHYVHILVRDARQMMYLWDNGFFGTGQLSRSEPTWKERTMTRINADSSSSNGNIRELNLERITEERRRQRSEFKRKRVEMEKQLLDLRREGGSIEQESILLEKEREQLRSFKALQSSTNSTRDEPLGHQTEIDDLFDENGELLQLESLELMPVEAIFLSFTLPVLDIKPETLIHRLMVETEPSYKNLYPLVKQYVAYHHYRSHGWCVRSGIKFGCDYLLYKRGPPFQHAQFCITVLDSEERHDYTWYSSVARVVGGAKKTLVLCYVQRMVSEEKILQLWKQKDFVKVFSSFKIGEVIYRRWVPGKNRD